jgi:hypothetical protein
MKSVKYVMKSVINPRYIGSGSAGAEQLFLGFGLRALFCAGVFAEQKTKFSELNSRFSVRVFSVTARDALRRGSTP